MGIIRNLAVKTAIKKALLTVNDSIESLASPGEDLATTYGLYVELFFNNNPDIQKLREGMPFSDTWEAGFTLLVVSHAHAEMPTAGLIRSQKDRDQLNRLVCQWLSFRSGTSANVARLVENLSI